MKLYKLTTKDDKTRPGKTNETQWGENVTHEAKGEGSSLCSNQVIHAYTDPFLAVFMDSIHGGYGADAHLWECIGEPVDADGTKVGCKCLTTVRRIPLPKLTVEQRVEIAVRCALAVYSEESVVKWAENWLSGNDRSAASARVALAAADTAVYDYAAAARAALAAAASRAAADAAAANTAFAATRAAACAIFAAGTAATFAADAAIYADVDIVDVIYQVVSSKP